MLSSAVVRTLSLALKTAFSLLFSSSTVLELPPSPKLAFVTSLMEFELNRSLANSSLDDDSSSDSSNTDDELDEENEDEEDEKEDSDKNDAAAKRNMAFARAMRKYIEEEKKSEVK